MKEKNNKEFKTNTDVANQLELNELIQQNYTTKRATRAELEHLLYKPIPVLDHGFIRIIDYMGNDAAITQAARVSYGKGTKQQQNDKALINYLLHHDHTSPFEMCEIKLHIKAPIFVARQWVRHRTANINEYSGRYSIMNTEYYIPEVAQLKQQSTTNKQGREEQLPPELQQPALDILNRASESAFKDYAYLMQLAAKKEDTPKETEAIGLSRELARIILPLNIYTEFYWKIDLHNLMHFLRLRVHPHAQYEIRVYAQVMLDILEKWVPLVHQAFIKYKQNAIKLSAEAYRVINDLLKQVTVCKKDYSLSKREWGELLQQFNLKDRIVD